MSGSTDQGSGNIRFQGCQGGSYNSLLHAPTCLHTQSHTSRWIWQVHAKNNKLHEGMQWSHTNDFSYMQACEAILEEIFWPAESESLRLRSTVFEMHLSYGAWCSPFKPFPTVCAKTVYKLLRGST